LKNIRRKQVLETNFGTFLKRQELSRRGYFLHRWSTEPHYLRLFFGYKKIKESIITTPTLYENLDYLFEEPLALDFEEDTDDTEQNNVNAVWEEKVDFNEEQNAQILLSQEAHLKSSKSVFDWFDEAKEDFADRFNITKVI